MATPKKLPIAAADISPAAFGPIHNRIGPIFDPAWLKLIDERVLTEIVSIQLDTLADQLDLEKRAIGKIKSVVAKR